MLILKHSVVYEFPQVDGKSYHPISPFAWKSRTASGLFARNELQRNFYWIRLERLRNSGSG